MSDHTHFVSLSICLSIDLAFSRRIFHTLKLTLHPSQSRSYLHCEGDSKFGLIYAGIYSSGFRLYFRSIRATTTPNTVATTAPPPIDSLWLGHRSLARPFSPSTLHHGIIAKTLLFSLIITNQLQNYTPIVHLEWNKF